jgi:hypothetical protein
LPVGWQEVFLRFISSISPNERENRFLADRRDGSLEIKKLPLSSSVASAVRESPIKKDTADNHSFPSRRPLLASHLNYHNTHTFRFLERPYSRARLFASHQIKSDSRQLQFSPNTSGPVAGGFRRFLGIALRHSAPTGSVSSVTFQRRLRYTQNLEFRRSTEISSTPTTSQAADKPLYGTSICPRSENWRAVDSMDNRDHASIQVR